MIDKFIKFLKNNSRIIYFIYLYFIFSLVCSNLIEFKYDGITTIWSVQAAVSILAITMIAIIMGYNETKIFGTPVREIIFNKKIERRERQKSNGRRINIEKTLDIVVFLMGLYILNYMTIKNPYNTDIVFMILSLLGLWVYLVNKTYKNLKKNYVCITFCMFTFFMRNSGLELTIIDGLMSIILINEIVEHRCEITYYERIVTAIVFVGICGIFTVKNTVLGVALISMASLVNVLYLTYYRVEYILNYDDFKLEYKQSIIDEIAQNIELENGENTDE